MPCIFAHTIPRLRLKPAINERGASPWARAPSGVIKDLLGCSTYGPPYQVNKRIVMIGQLKGIGGDIKGCRLDDAVIFAHAVVKNCTLPKRLSIWLI
jgi:hypothetical protein